MSSQAYNLAKQELLEIPRTWLVTGAAGFIGSTLVEELLRLNQKVVGLDNFSTGKKHNLVEIERLLPGKFANFQFIEGDIRNPEDCRRATRGVDYVLHQGALGSVPRSIEAPVASADSNVMGFFQIISAAQAVGAKSFVYASSSSVYGDLERLPQVESSRGNLLSPYALTKYVNEITAEVYARVYGLNSVGLRYFNVFGARQDPEGPYAAVIPLWVRNFLNKEAIFINGDGSTSRDFCYIKNVVQANILAALSGGKYGPSPVYNISNGGSTSLNELFVHIQRELGKELPEVLKVAPIYRESRQGDIKHSVADISLAKEQLGYRPEFNVQSGLSESIDWYKRNLKR
jgi:UDP-N-acetylglucosamine/UDP-N-acetylgalactosamine 4-epimerase